MSYSGFVNGDTATSLTTQPTLVTTATSASHVADNPYIITASGAVDANYTIRYVAGSLTVTPAPLTVTANNQTKAYGAALPTLTASYSGFVNGDTSASLTTPPTVMTTATAASHVANSPYMITASGAVDSDYSFTYLTGALTVTPVALAITAVNQNKIYGATLPALTATYSGFVNGDTSTSLTTQPTLTTTATEGSHISGNPYAITASGAVDSDYTISYASGVLTVTPAALTITADNNTKPYGAALPILTASYTGFVNGDSSTSLGTQPTLSTTATAHSDTGLYPITASGAADPDYTISYQTGTLTVTAVGLTITANHQTKVYGAALPSLTASYAGFVNGDSSTSLTTQPTLTTTATAGSHVADNPYTITASGAVDSNYTIAYVAGSLIVTTAPLTITAENQTKLYGAALPALTVSYSGFVAGDTASDLSTPPTVATPATAHSDTGVYAITASGAVDSDYAISYVAGTLTVSPATLTVTANNQTRPPGEANPPLTYTITGLVNGDSSSVVSGAPILSTTAIIASPAGQYPIDITAGSLSAANYDFTTVGGTLTVANNAPITIGPATLPVATVGDPYSQQLTASGGSGSGYTFGATGLPAGLSLSPTGLLSGTPTTATGSPFAVDVTVTDGDGGTGSQNYSLTVKAKTITGVIVTSLPQTYYGQEVTLTATFTATDAGSAPMTGTVAFYDGNTYLGTEPLFAIGDPSGTSSCRRRSWRSATTSSRRSTRATPTTPPPPSWPPSRSSCSRP